MNRPVTAAKSFAMASLATLAGLAPGHAAPMFRGYLTTGKDTCFGVATSGDTATEWKAIGQSIGAFQIVGFDATMECLILEKLGVTYRVFLPHVRVVSPPGGKDTIHRLRLAEALAQAGDARLAELLREFALLQTDATGAASSPAADAKVERMLERIEARAIEADAIRRAEWSDSANRPM